MVILADCQVIDPPPKSVRTDDQEEVSVTKVNKRKKQKLQATHAQVSGSAPAQAVTVGSGKSKIPSIEHPKSLSSFVNPVEV